jgi:hypothetical protein
MTWKNRIVGTALVDPGTLVPNKKNWRTHPRKQQEAIAGTLGELGWIQDVIVNQRTGRMIDGHERVQQAMKHKESEVPVKYVDLTEEEERRALATFDPLGALAGVDTVKLTDLLEMTSSEDNAVSQLLEDMHVKRDKAKKRRRKNDSGKEREHEEQTQAAAELQERWGTALGQIWEIPSKSEPGRAHRIICGNSLDERTVDRLVREDKVAMMLTDPPYNVDYKYTGGGNDKRDAQEYRDFCTAYMHVARRFTTLQVVTPGKGNERNYPDWIDYVVWYKGFAFTHGRVSRTLVTEPCLVFGTKPKNKWYPTDYIHARNLVLKDAGRHHTCPKPVELFEKLIEPMTDRGDVVYDAFLGSGTTLLAAEKIGRICYGVELDPLYVAVILQRATEIDLKPVLIDNG